MQTQRNVWGRVWEPETRAQIARITADGGTIVDARWMNLAIRTMKQQGIYSSCKFLGDANFAYRNETGVDTLYDISGNNNDAVQATDANQPVWTAAQQNGKAAVVFTAASSHYLNAGDILTTSAALSVLFVFNPAAWGDMGIVTKHSGATGGWNTYFFADGTMQYQTRSAGGLVSALTTNTHTIGTTYIGTGIYDGSNDNLFRNGTLDGGPLEATGAIGDTTNMNIARDVNGASNYFDGSILYVGVFSTALSTAQRQAMESLINSYYAIY